MLQANQPSNEVFMNMFMIWGIALWLRADSAQAGWGHYAAAGLFLGLVTLIKPALVTVACMGLAWLPAEGLNPAALKRRAWTMKWVLLPIAASWGLMVLYFVWQGRAGELYNCLVRYGVFYARSGGQGTSSIGMNILRGFSEELIPHYMVFLAPLMLLTALGIRSGLRDGQRSQALTLVGCLFGTFLAVSIPGWFYPHYYQLYLPILAVGAGWGIVTVANSLQQRTVGQWIGTGTLLLLLWHIAPNYRYDSKTWSRLKYPGMGGFFIEIERCGHAVNRMLKPGEPFYAWGIDPGIYYYSERQPASGIFWADRLFLGPLKTQATQKVIADLEKTQPPLILTENLIDRKLPLDHPVYQWIWEHYVESPEAGFSKFFTVYLRRDSALAFRLSANQKPFVLTLDDVDPAFLRQVSNELLQKERAHEAMAYLQKAVEIDPDHPEDYNNLAWQLATSSGANIRDGRRAVELAKHACELTDFKQTIFVGTLAAAYAEAGQFIEAIAAAEKACALATESGDPALLQRNQELLELYRKHLPYHEPVEEFVPTAP
jgi:tetratricopeptide (TPR) repeat protein